MSNTYLMLLLLAQAASASTLSTDYLDSLSQRYSLKPEIHHVFKPDPKRPNPFIASVFLVLLTVIPFLGLKRILPGITQNPGSKSLLLSTSASAKLLLFSFAAYLLLLICFFAGLNFPTTGLIGSVIVSLGWLAVSGLA